jgi:hypothetical protein
VDLTGPLGPSLHRPRRSSPLDIPPFSLISLEPEATVTCPSMVDKIPNQETIHFTLTGKVDAYPGPARTFFPALTLFRGISDYSEVLLPWIEAPLLGQLSVIFLDTAQLARFI